MQFISFASCRFLSFYCWYWSLTYLCAQGSFHDRGLGHAFHTRWLSWLRPNCTRLVLFFWIEFFEQDEEKRQGSKCVFFLIADPYLSTNIVRCHLQTCLFSHKMPVTRWRRNAAKHILLGPRRNLFSSFCEFLTCPLSSDTIIFALSPASFIKKYSVFAVMQASKPVMWIHFKFSSSSSD